MDSYFGSLLKAETKIVVYVLAPLTIVGMIFSAWAFSKGQQQAQVEESCRNRANLLFPSLPYPGKSASAERMQAYNNQGLNSYHSYAACMKKLGYKVWNGNSVD